MARVLWIDLCVQPSRHGLAGWAADQHQLLQIDQIGGVAGAVREFSPQFICVEFDYPDGHRLQAVTRTRLGFPALPLLMFTEHHSEALALWAFRSGVWDYRVKPVERPTLKRCLEIAAQLGKGPAPGHRATMPADLIEPAGHLVRPPSAAPRTGPAVAYLLKHYGEVIARHTLAELCHLCGSEFSRAFRRENGVTVDGFLLGLRIAKARDFLAEPGISVSECAYAAGFNDISYFCRVFRRSVGMTAGSYQKRVVLRSAREKTPAAGADQSKNRANRF
jgi:AraC-like DNA-binding protein